MGKFAGGFLRLTSTALYALEFCCAAVGLGVYSYFLARLAKNDRVIQQDWRAVEGLTGSGVLYTIFAVLLTCFLGGHRVFAFIAIFLDVLFCAAFIAVAVLTRDGADSCTGRVETPLGNGRARQDTPFGANLGLACRLNTAVFATALIAAFLFLISAILQFFMMRNHQKEKKYGPSPKNNYTSGSGGKFWKKKPKTTKDAYARDTEMNSGAAQPSTNGRTSHETGYTGTTMNTSDQYGSANSKYEAPHSGYHTGPTGTSVNPYGYDSKPTGTAVNY